MKFNKYSHLTGLHATLSPSGSSWLRYSPEKVKSVWLNNIRKQEGTELHQLASDMINKGVRAAKLKNAFNMFVNDAIGFDMESEVLLYYSDNCFGTADAIQYYEHDKLLRVHDLKTGIHKVTFEQLFVYCALFCLEYKHDPFNMQFECRIYQGNGYEVFTPDPYDISEIMHKISELDYALTEVISDYYK